MTADRLLVISSIIASKYPRAVIRYSRRIAGTLEYNELVIFQDNSILAYVDIENGTIHAQPGVEL